MRLDIKEVDNMPTLCLNMIVKNESKVIKRLLQSVVSIIDTYCICDTGSTDNTIDLIIDFFQSHNIQGKVVEEPFKDFGYNRSYALKAATGMSDYALLLDADMILEVHNFDKSMLNEADSFCILQGNDDFYYQNMRIVRNNGEFTYHGVTHEHVSTPPDNHNVNVRKDQLFINDVGDGGAKDDKFERDIRLLKQGIEDEPDNVRYHFYLANSYKDSGNFEKAIEYYKKRIDMGDWEQEIWYSYYNIANIYEAQDDMGNAIVYWLKCFNQNPNRLENIHKLVQYYRMIGECQTAKLFYDIASKVMKNGTNRDEFLFLANDVYAYKFDYEYSIIGCYLGLTDMNDSFTKIFNNCTDQGIIINTLSNLKFYPNILPTKDLIDLTYIEHRDVGHMDKEFFSSSSCIIPNQDNTGYRMNIRLVNYWINSSGGYLNCEDYIISNNKYLEMDKDFNITKEKIFEVDFDPDKHYIGVEDIRIFPHEKDPSKLVYTGCSQHTDGEIGMLYGDYDINKDIITSSEVVPSFSKEWCEKNWVYFNYRDENHLIYKWSPLQICKINKETDKLDLVELREGMPKIFLHARGSSPGSRFNNEYWFVIHIVSYEVPRHYYHVIVKFDENMNFVKHSAPFKFEGEPIEYCLGIVVEEDRVIMPYSSWDRNTKIAIYDKGMIEERMKYPIEE